jgi:hypothetical protein
MRRAIEAMEIAGRRDFFASAPQIGQFASFISLPTPNPPPPADEPPRRAPRVACRPPDSAASLPGDLAVSDDTQHSLQPRGLIPASRQCSSKVCIGVVCNTGTFSALRCSAPVCQGGGH